MNEGNTFTLSQILGHSSVETTEILKLGLEEIAELIGIRGASENEVIILFLLVKKYLL